MWIYAWTPLSPPIAALMETSLMSLICGQRHALNIHFAVLIIVKKKTKKKTTTTLNTAEFEIAKEQSNKTMEFADIPMARWFRSVLGRNTKQACSCCAVNMSFVLNQILIFPTWQDSLEHLSLSTKHNKMWLVIMAESWTMISAGWRTQVQYTLSPFSSSD